MSAAEAELVVWLAGAVHSSQVRSTTGARQVLVMAALLTAPAELNANLTVLVALNKINSTNLN